MTLSIRIATPTPIPEASRSFGSIVIPHAAHDIYSHAINAPRVHIHTIPNDNLRGRTIRCRRIGSSASIMKGRPRPAPKFGSDPTSKTIYGWEPGGRGRTARARITRPIPMRTITLVIVLLRGRRGVRRLTDWSLFICEHLSGWVRPSEMVG
jgi:hypothetical protein